VAGYNSFGRVQSLQRPDLISESLTALQMQGLATGTTSVTVLAVEDQAFGTELEPEICGSASP
jgi:hypothetical protein